MKGRWTGHYMGYLWEEQLGWTFSGLGQDRLIRRRNFIRLGTLSCSELYRAQNIIGLGTSSELRTFYELGTFTVIGLPDEISQDYQMNFHWNSRLPLYGLDPWSRVYGLGLWSRVLFCGYTLCLVGGHQDILFVFVCGSWLEPHLGLGERLVKQWQK